MGGEKTGFRGFGGFGFARIFSGQVAGAGWIGVGLLAGLGFGFAFGFCLSGFGLGWVGLRRRGVPAGFDRGLIGVELGCLLGRVNCRGMDGGGKLEDWWWRGEWGD